MIPEDTEMEPASVYLCVSPECKVTYLRQFPCGWFFSFLEQEVSIQCRSMNKEIPDSWMMEYRFANPKQIPPFTNTDNSHYLSLLLPVTESSGIWPEHVIRLRDAVFCQMNGIDPLSPEGAHDRLLGYKFDDEKSREKYEYLLSETCYDFPCWKALDTAYGVLLFSESDRGAIAYQLYREYINLYCNDPKLKIDSLNEYRVPMFMTSFVGYVDKFLEQRLNEPILLENFAPKELLRSGMFHARYTIKFANDNTLHYNTRPDVFDIPYIPIRDRMITQDINLKQTRTNELLQPEQPPDGMPDPTVARGFKV